MSTRKVILVADDEAVLRNIVRTLLHEEGYEVLAAADGNEALRLSRTHEGKIDLLLTDMEMPRLDGISTYRRISAERRDIKVLFMSGAFPEPLKVLNGLPFLPKPFVTAALRTKVREVLEVTSSAAVA
ncbi:MAG: response regulator [Acidobacteria bacterium]|nr:MAG: response regulator [Acidobacteriota bacterium]